MNIVIDIRCLNDYPFTGVANYALSVMDNLFVLDKNNQYILFNNSYAVEGVELLAYVNRWKQQANVKYFNLKWPNKVFNFLLGFKLLSLNRLLSKKMSLLKIDCWWMPNLNYINLTSDLKLFTTVHDLSFYYFPSFFSWKQRLWHAGLGFKKLYHRADCLLSVSRSTAFDLRGMGVPDSKIKVFPLGIDRNVFRKIDDDGALQQFVKKYSLPKRFFVFVATLEARKNLEVLLVAWSSLSLRDRLSHPLFLIGKKTKYWKNLSQKYWGRGRENYDSLWSEMGVFVMSYVSKDDLPYFYNLATALLYPSCYEGFGLPPLEALACNCPIVVGRNSALLENFSGALTIDTENDKELTGLLFDFIHGKITREQAFPKDFKIDKYSWENYAKNLLNLFNQYENRD